MPRVPAQTLAVCLAHLKWLKPEGIRRTEGNSGRLYCVTFYKKQVSCESSDKKPWPFLNFLYSLDTSTKMQKQITSRRASQTAQQSRAQLFLRRLKSGPIFSQIIDLHNTFCCIFKSTFNPCKNHTLKSYRRLGEYFKTLYNFGLNVRIRLTMHNLPAKKAASAKYAKMLIPKKYSNF